MSENVVIYKPNRSQQLLHLVNPNVAYCMWPRGGGKTSGGIGPRIVHLSEVMPRSQVIIFSDTFERIHDRVTPNIIGYITNDLGLIEDQDFVVFKKPPSHFDKPLIPLKKYDHVITFSSGFSLCGASQKVSGSANAYNAQALIVDETKYVRETTLTTEVYPAIRGAKSIFGHLPEYMSKWHFTDKWPGKGADVSWLLKKKELCDDKMIKAILSVQMEIQRMQEDVKQYTSTATIYKYHNRIVQLETWLNKVRQNLVYYSNALPYENLEALGEKYFRDQKRELSRLEYAVAIENEDPDKVENSYYPSYIEEVHCHHHEDDIDLNRAIDVAFDYQWRIVPMVAAQMVQLPGDEFLSYNILAGVHSLHEEDGGIKLTVQRFCQLMKSLGYTHNQVNYYYDHTAVAKSPVTAPFYQIVINEFKAMGWFVNPIYMGQASEMDIRHEYMKRIIGKSGEGQIRFNHARTKFLRKSIEKAGTVKSNGRTKKDKSQEKMLSVPATETTDYSEAFDVLITGRIERRLTTSTTASGIPIRAN
jgi:hypothetical protein